MSFIDHKLDSQFKLRCDSVAVTGLNKWIAVFSVGIVCTFYTTAVSIFSNTDMQLRLNYV